MEQKKAPTRQGWISALIVLPIGALLFIPLYEGGRSIISSIGLNLAREHYTQNSFKESTRYLEAIAAIPSAHGILHRAGVPYADKAYYLNPFATTQDTLPLTTLEELGISVTGRSPKNITRSLAAVEKNEALQTLLTTRALQNEWRAIKVLAEDHAKALARSSSAAAKMPVSEDDLHRYRSRYMELRQNVLQLIRIPYGAEEAPFGFYTEGVLTGLPLLGGVPDNQSLEQLRDTLRRLGGSAAIPVDTPNPRAYFLDAVENLRKDSQNFRELLETQDISLTEDAVSKQDSAQIIQSDETLLMTKLHALFAACISPKN